MNSRIKMIRKESGMTQEQFAERIGASKSSIVQYESGYRRPSSAVIRAISREFKVNETWLLAGEGEMHDPPTDEQEIANVVQMLHTGNERIKKDIIIGLSKAKEESLLDILGHILRELHSHGIDLNFDNEEKK